MRAFLRFIMAICIGVAGTLAWQAYGDEARQMIAQQWPELTQRWPQLAWLVPSPAADATPAAQAEAAEETAVSAPAAAALAAPGAGVPAPQAVLPPEFVQQMEAMARDLATARQGLDQLTASQGEMARNIAKLQATEQDILHKLTQPAPRPAARSVPPPQSPPQLSSVPRPAPVPTAPSMQPTPLAPPR